MTEAISYGMKRTVSLSFDDALERIQATLKDEGFGVLTEIDVKETLKKKLDVDFRRYRILGACNPPLAHRALTAETDIGLLLPCNVIVYEGEEKDRTVISVLDPIVQLGATGRDDMTDLATEVKERMGRALAAV